MVRPKKGTKAGNIATERWRATMLAKHGGKEELHKAMQMMGQKGGKASTTGGFYAKPELAKIAGAKGGAISSRAKNKLPLTARRAIYNLNKMIGR